MMLRLIAAVIVFLAVLTACIPQLVNVIEPACPKLYECTFTQTGIEVVTGGPSKGFTVASSEEITAFSSVTVGGKETCKYRAVAGGPRNAIVCLTPNVVSATTRGAVQVLTLNTAPSLKASQ